MKIATVVGARPQFVKAAVVSPKLRALGIEERLIHTGQHYDLNLSERFFHELALPSPHHNLGVGGGRHGRQTGRMLEGIESVLLQNPVDLVLVYGDTNSTLAGALAAAKLHLPIAHVEAGLRSFNRAMPEEINRIVTDHLSEILFVPNEAARVNLSSEGIAGDSVRMVGDVMLELATAAATRVRNDSSVLDRYGLEPGAFVVATIHRAENTNDTVRLRSIVSALARISLTTPVIWPVHPRTQREAGRVGIDLSGGGMIRLVEPVGYLEMIALQLGSCVVATDSGGMQKEAFFLGRPCVTIRTETEWVELVEAGWNVLVNPSDPAAIVAAISDAVSQKPQCRPDLYGRGDAGDLIAKAIWQYGVEASA